MAYYKHEFQSEFPYHRDDDAIREIAKAMQSAAEHLNKELGVAVGFNDEGVMEVAVCQQFDKQFWKTHQQPYSAFIRRDEIDPYGPSRWVEDFDRPAGDTFDYLVGEWEDGQEEEGMDREDNPSGGHSTGMMVGIGIGAFIVGSMVTAASYNSVVVGPLFRRIQELEKKPPTP